MDYQKYIADMVPGDRFEGFYVLTGIQLRRSNAGKTYLSATMNDATGNVDLKLWDFNGYLGEEQNGCVFYVRGEASEYKGSPQVTAQVLRPTDERDSYDLSALVPCAPMDVNVALEDVKALVASLEDADYRSICEEMLSRHFDSFRTIPAAKSVHHAFIAGLLMHTANMLQVADFLAAQYSYAVDRSLLLAGTLLHDFGKEQEFTFSPLGLVVDYSVKGDLLGHLYMGALEVAEVAAKLGVPEEKSVLLQHLLLSHHGEPERGAAVIPQCAESELLSLIDQIDSRMEIYAETMETTPAGSFSPRIYALDKKIYHHG